MDFDDNKLEMKDKEDKFFSVGACLLFSFFGLVVVSIVISLGALANVHIWVSILELIAQ